MTVARLLSLAWVVVLLAGFCSGQSSDRVQIFGGYSYVYPDFSLTGPTGMSGWNASATFATKHHWGFVADFSGYYPGYNFGCTGCGQSAKVHTFLFGPQVSFTRGRLTPFARFLLGDSHITTALDGVPNYQTFTSNNAFTFGAGGGVDFGLTRRFALRGQVDWLHNGFQTSDNQRSNETSPNVVRVSTGIVFRF